MKYEEILERMLDKVTSDVDKREGSIIYDALAPAAAELAQLYAQIDYLNLITFADEAVGEHLTMRCSERGIDRRMPTSAVREGVFSKKISIGSRFGIEDIIYEVSEKIGEEISEQEKVYLYRLICEQAGTIGNLYEGDMLPISGVNNIEKASLSKILIPGEDIERDEELRKRYFESLKSEGFGGNIADYIERTNKINGVGGVKVYPVWNGGGTIKVVFIDSSYNKPSSEQVSDVQTIIDPVTNQGNGIGFAPIGHVVTVSGVENALINIESNIILKNGFLWKDVEADVEKTIIEYFKDLRVLWDSSKSLVIRIAHIESKILTLPGVLDIEGTKLNGENRNIELKEVEIPVLGSVSNE